MNLDRNKKLKKQDDEDPNANLSDTHTVDKREYDQDARLAKQGTEAVAKAKCKLEGMLLVNDGEQADNQESESSNTTEETDPKLKALEKFAAQFFTAPKRNHPTDRKGSE